MPPVGYTVLVVEDEPLISLLIEDMVAEFDGGICVCVRSVQAALTILADQKPNMALLDIDLGTGTSLEVAAQCKYLGIPVIFMTGFKPCDIPLECGLAPILFKPFSQTDIGRALEAILDAPGFAVSKLGTQSFDDPKGGVVHC